MKNAKNLSIRLIAFMLLVVFAISLASCSVVQENPTPSEPTTYTVTLDSAGGTSVASQTVESGTKATEPTAPTKNGYTFLGWYLGDEEWEFHKHAVTEDMTLTAKWEKIKVALPEFDTATPVTITIYHPFTSQRQALIEAINDFCKKYPNVTVEQKSLGSHNFTLEYTIESIKSNVSPNVVVGYSFHFTEYNELGALVDLAPYVEDGTLGFTNEELDDLLDGILDEGKSLDGESNYYIPFSKGTDVLYYNKTLFTKHSLSAPTTWDEMENVLKTLKTLYPKSIPLAFNSESNLFLQLAMQLGAPNATADNPFAFNDDAYMDIVERLRTWYQNGWITTTELLGEYADTYFSNGGSCFMIVAASNSYGYCDPGSRFELGVAPVPQLNNTDPKALSTSSSLAVLENDDPQKVIASWLFVKHLVTDTKFQSSASMAKIELPVVASAVTTPEFISFLAATDATERDKCAALTMAAALLACDYTSDPDAYSGSPTVRNELTSIIVKCLSYKGSDVKKYIKSVFDEAVKNLSSPKEEPSTPPAGNYDLEAVVEYLGENYVSSLDAPYYDYTLAPGFYIDEVMYTLIWSTNDSEITVSRTVSLDPWSVDLPDSNETTRTYTLTVTVVAPDETSATGSFTITLPVY